MILEAQRLLLREMNPDDFQALFQVLGDPETMWHYPYTFDGQHVRDWIERNMKRYRKDGFGLWAVCLKDSGEMIGDCGLTLQKHQRRNAPRNRLSYPPRLPAESLCQRGCQGSP